VLLDEVQTIIADVLFFSSQLIWTWCECGWKTSRPVVCSWRKKTVGGLYHIIR